ncbi:UNVERIFIED_CONTAM: hypothetical protein GTU68_052522 [Idotea baltica]|nr:hypothetical protein [Idotea baltica]
MNGAEALAYLNNGRKFDLILLDVMMPKMSGYEVCQKIREKFLPSELPVIMVTAKNQVQDLVQGLTLGANDYLAKPFTKEEFLARVKTQLDLHRINEVTAKFVPHEFLRALGYESITEVGLGDLSHREVSVLFTDIRGYTTLSEQMTPEDNFRFVNAFHGRMGPVIKRNNGFVNQYLGDAIMAIFPKSPTDALNASIEMQKALSDYNEKRIKDGHVPIRIGVGFHTGPLVMGIIGDENRLDAATIADTVNASSRIESLTKHYGASILLSDDSLKKTEDPLSYHIRFLGNVQVKGKSEPIGIYECFDGDSPEVLKLKTETQPDFDQGLMHYYGRQFHDALDLFEKILQINPKDRVVRLFHQKASEFMVEGVPEDWTGVEKMERK